jgi:TrmH family RNA methyltransferase
MGSYSGRDCVFHRLIIRLRLVGTTELREQRRAGDIDSRLCYLAVADAGQNTCERDADVCALLLLHLLDRMAKYDVTDLVTKNAGELGHVLSALDEASVHIDEPAGHGKRIYFTAVDDEEPPIETGAARVRRDLIAEEVDVAIGFRIGDHGQLLIDLRSFLLTHLHFLLGGYPAARHPDYQRERDKDSFHWNSRGKLLTSAKGKSHSKLPTFGSSVRILTLARDLRRRKSRERQSLFVVEGVRAVEELLKSPLSIQGVLSAPQLADAPRGQALLETIASSRIEHAAVKEAEFRSAAETESPQGVLAIAETPDRSLDSVARTGKLRVLVLDALQDPGNVGTILRTAAALDVDATVALPGTVDLWNAKVVRSAMGAHFHHLAFHAKAEDLFAFLDAEPIPLWGADSSGNPVDSVSAPDRLALVVGNEGGGLSSSVRERASATVSLPIASTVESLNVAVATGILLYQLRK